MGYRGRMSAYAIDEIPNLPDKTETVARQKEKVIIGDKARKWLCGITFSTMLCVVFAILFAVFLSLYIKLNGDYKDIKEENDELNLANESITMQNTELEITNGLLLQENEILNNTLIIITQDAINMNVNITELINILMNDYNTTKTELSLLQSKYDILIEKYQTYGLSECKETRTANKMFHNENFAKLDYLNTKIQLMNEKINSQNLELSNLRNEKSVLVVVLEELKERNGIISSNYVKFKIKFDSLAKKYTVQSQNYARMREIPNLKAKNGLLVNELDNLEEKIISSEKERKEEEIEQEEKVNEEEADGPKPPNTDIKNPLLGFITLVDSYSNSNEVFMKYKWNSSGNNDDYCVSSMNTFCDYPRRGEMNSRGIYVLPDAINTKIGFYDLSSFGTSPVIRSQSGSGGYYGGSCGFMDDDTAICVTLTTGDIYKYNITNNYEQVRIASNNPSGKGFESVLITKEKQILAAYKGRIYIYNSSGHYITYSGNSQQGGMYQMKEIRSNIILTAEYLYVYLHDISNTWNIIRHQLLHNAKTHNYHLTLELLEGNTGNIAIGGYKFVSGTYYGYVELFHLDEGNSTLLPKSNKRWVGDSDCHIYIIRKIQTGVMIFGGNDDCADICTWEYAVIPHKNPICFPLGGLLKRDIISLP